MRNMFNFDRRSVMIDIFSMSIMLLILSCAFLLSGCAVSGCGNPTFDSNDYINEQNSVVINAPAHKLRQRFDREKITGKHKKHI
jgi:hypothetical protein